MDGSDVEQIRKDVSGVKEAVAEMRGELRAHAKRIEELVADHHDTLYGNGRPGLKTSVDRLEQAEIRRSSHLKWIWGVIGAIAAKIGIDFVSRGGGGGPTG